MHKNQRHLTIARISSIVIPFFILITTVSGLAASVSLRWDPNDPTPEGYRVFARRSDQVYDYSLPDWEGSTVGCTIDNLEDQTDYYFVVRAYDGSLESADSEEVHYIPADPANQSPVAVDDSYTVNEGGTLNITAGSGVLANDDDPEEDSLTVALAGGVAHGSLTLNANGSFSYIHDSTDTVTDGFSYTLSDGHGNTDTGRVSITITPVDDPPPPASNQPPNAVNDSYSVAEGGTLSIAAGSGVLANDSDPDGDTLTASLSNGTANGTLNLNANGSFTYVHNSGETLSDNFAYTLSDGQGHTDTASVSITITPVNDAPTARAGNDWSVAEGLSITLNGSGSTDPDDATLSFLWQQIGGPSATLSSANSVRPTVTAPQVDTDGATLVFRLTVRDGAGASSSDTCRVTVTNTVDDTPPPVNDPDTDDDGIPDSGDEDDDDDGMPDDWETLFGLNPVVDDADDDRDQDGISNRDEYRAGLDPDDPGEGAAPQLPTTVSPASYAQVTRNPVIQLEAYSDADGDAHIATQWQAYDTSSGDCLLDVVTDRRLNRLRVPRLLLNGDHTYHWRVRFFDSGGRASAWSAASYFVTDEAADDLDGNGIPDDQEGGEVQVNVSRSVSSMECEPTEIVVASEGTISEIEQVVLLDPAEFEIDETTPARLPSAMLAYKLVLDQPGQRALVTIHLSDEAPDGSKWLKYDAVNGWQDYSDHTVFSADCQSVTVEIKDGGYGDADGVANGIIVDPAGLSTTAERSASTASTSGGGGGGGGCFISAAHIAKNQNASSDGPWQWIKNRLNRLMAGIVSQ